MRSFPFLALLAPLLAAAQDKPADDAAAFLKKVEDKHVAAKTLHIKSKIEVNSGGKVISFDCELWFAGGGRFRLSSAGKFDGMDVKTTAISDGSRLRIEAMGQAPRVSDLPKGMAGAIRCLAGRCGAMTAMMPMEKKPEDFTTDAIAATVEGSATDEKAGDKTLKVLQVSLKAKDEKDALKMKISVDPDTLAVVRRSSTTPQDEKVTEAAVDTTFDEELKDELFVLPKDEPKEPAKDDKK